VLSAWDSGILQRLCGAIEFGQTTLLVGCVLRSWAALLGEGAMPASHDETQIAIDGECHITS